MSFFPPRAYRDLSKTAAVRGESNGGGTEIGY